MSVNSVNPNEPKHGRNTAIGVAVGAAAGATGGYILTKGAKVEDSKLVVRPDVFQRAVSEAAAQEATEAGDLTALKEQADKIFKDVVPTDDTARREMIKNLPDDSPLLKNADDGTESAVAIARNILKGDNPDSLAPEQLTAATEALKKSKTDAQVEYLKGLKGKAAELPEVKKVIDGAEDADIAKAFAEIADMKAPAGKFTGVLLANDKGLAEAVGKVAGTATEEQKKAVIEAYKKAVEADKSVEIKGIKLDQPDEAFTQIMKDFRAGKENLEGTEANKGVKAAIDECFDATNGKLKKTAEGLGELAKSAYENVKSAVKSVKIKGALIYGAAAAVVGGIVAFVVSKVNSNKTK